MRGGATWLACAAVLTVAACGAEEGKLTIRTSKAPTSASAQPVPERIAEARGQFALGNMALALESFRKALRDDPRSIAAMTGIAACYDQMGRFDLARRHYEAALAVEPANTEVLAALATSLDRQGRREEASAVRAEIGQRLTGVQPVEAVVALQPPTMIMSEPAIAGEAIALNGHVTAPAAVAVLPADEVAEAPVSPSAEKRATPVTVAARSVTMALPPARPASAEQARVAPVKRPGARLERLSMGEVALVTASTPQWQPTLVASSARSATIRFVPLKQAAAASRSPSVRLLNAARVEGLAARTRTLLATRGWRNIAIGDAALARPSSLVVYPAAGRSTAKRLAAQFGIPSMLRPDVKHVTLLIGRDAATRKRPVA